jgi:hypothetical protein
MKQLARRARKEKAMKNEPFNNQLKPIHTELQSATSLLLDGKDNICLDAVRREDGRWVYVSLTEQQAERLIETLNRAVSQGMWGDLTGAIVIPHRPNTRTA